MKGLPGVTIKKGEWFYYGEWARAAEDFERNQSAVMRLTLEEAKKLGLEPPREERQTVWTKECQGIRHYREDVFPGAVRCVELREGEFIVSREKLAKAWDASVAYTLMSKASSSTVYNQFLKALESEAG